MKYFGVPRAAAPREAGIKYVGSNAALALLLVKGWLLALVTLGIYRFWLITDARRHLWSHTVVAGSSLEYTGRGRELLIGFLMALAIFIPLNIVVSLAALGGEGLQAVMTFLYVLVLAGLVPFALYRARRYRLSRTLMRGVRFDMAGSGVVYALRWIGWALATLLTLGFAYPWMHASLERYAVGHTHYGNKDAEFDGTGSALWRATILLQLIVMAPVLFAVVTLAGSAISGDLSRGGIGGLLLPNGQLNPFSPLFGALTKFALAVLVSFGLAMLLYPAYRAIELRWWCGGMRLGRLSLWSSLRIGQMYGLYLKFLGGLVLLLLALGGVGLFAAAFVGVFVNLKGMDLTTLGEQAQGAGLVFAIALYVVAAIAVAVLRQVMLWAGFWQVAARSITIVNPEVLETVGAARPKASAFGEGLADALDIGAF